MKNNEETLPLEPAEDVPVGTSDEQLAQLIADADETYRASATLGNLVAASTALNTKLRALNEQARRAEAKAEQRGELLSADPTDPNTWSDELGRWVIAYTDGILNRLAEVKTLQVIELEEA